MPTYEYECQKCGKVFEAFQKMSDEHLVSCINEECKGKVKRLIGTGGGFIFKGAGFYATDYRSKNYKDRERQQQPKSGSPCLTCNKEECKEKED